MDQEWVDLKIEAVLEEELYTTPPMMQVVVAKLSGSKQDIPKAFNLTKHEASISELKHLRRVRNSQNGHMECILCKLNLDKDQTIDEKLAEIRELYKSADIFTDYRVVLVPSSAPKTEHQLKACSTIWPCKFAKSNYLIQCIDGTVFDPAERKVLKIVVNSLLDHLNDNSDFQSGAVVFRYAQVYGVGLSSNDLVKQNPVKHSPMVAVDSVAKNAESGHWKKMHSHNGSDILLKSIQDKLKSQEDLKDHKIQDSFLPYLCTDYDIFVTEEPCMMCAMGLVQSRIRRLFYLDSSHLGQPPRGGCCKRVCYPDRAIEDFLVHRDKSLNHRFEAWRIKLLIDSR